jgi:glucose/arabinose dehydrogenase
MPKSARSIVILVVVALSLAVLGGSVAAAASDISLPTILDGYSRPVLVTHAPNGGRVIFIVEQTGKIKRATFRNGRWEKLNTFLDLSGKVNDPRKAGNSERGLLGLAFHPRYKQNGRFYVNYTRAGSGGNKGDSVIKEYRRKTSFKAIPSSGRTLMVVNQPGSNHNGGHLAFGPDGLLYIGFGDGGSSSNGRRLSSRLGALLRIDPLDPDGSGPRKFRTPGSNPRVGKSGLDSIWAWGLRNPWRYSFDRRNGNLWIGDVGQSSREEIDRSKSNGAGRNAGKGKDYGWDRCEGSRRYPNTEQRCNFGVRPVHDYAHGSGRCSVTGGYVYRGPSDSTWRGLYVGGDYCGRLFVLAGDGSVKLSKVTSRRISSLGEDAAGRLFATDLRGKILRVRMDGPRP